MEQKHEGVSHGKRLFMSTMPPSLDPMSCRHPMCEIFTCDSFAEPIVQTRVCPCERGVAGGPVSERLCVDIDTD